MKWFEIWGCALGLCGLVALPVAACYNGHNATLLNGIAQSEEDPFYTMPPPPAGRDLAAEAPANRRRLWMLDSAWHRHHRLADYTAYGLTLAYLGRYAEARTVFEQLEKWQPNQYSNAANLGTTYELLGENKLALSWIKRALVLNPGSHQGTEWLHVRILEAKLRGASALNAAFLLGLDFGKADKPLGGMLPDSATAAVLDSVQRALYYQPSERLSFVAPPDPVVGELLFELGNVYALTSNVEAALPVYRQAWRYGFHDKLLIKRYARFWRMHNELESTADVFALVFWIGLLVGVMFGVWRLGKAAWYLLWR